MADKVSKRRSSGLGLATLALSIAAVSGAVFAEVPAAAGAKAKAKAPPPPGRELFVDMSCGSCHVLKDAGGTGHVGPALDGTKLTKAFVAGRILNGQGAMPSFNGALTKAEIDEIAAYVSEESNK